MSLTSSYPRYAATKSSFWTCWRKDWRTGLASSRWYSSRDRRWTRGRRGLVLVVVVGFVIVIAMLERVAMVISEMAMTEKR